MSDLTDRMFGVGARRILLGVAFVALLLAVGFATYLFGGKGDAPDTEPETAAVRLTQGMDRGGYEVLSSLSLPWGAGSGGVAMSPEARRSTLDQVFLGSGERIYVVDHVPGRIGARMRWFEGGSLVGTHEAPAGSTLFTASEDGFMYVIAKGDESSERVVVVDDRGSVAATYTVPLQLNSGGLVRIDETLYARVFRSESDPDAQTYEASDLLVPVAIDGKQADDATADEQVVEAWTVLTDGVKVQQRLEGAVGESKEFEISRFVRYGTAREVEVPYEAVLMGASTSEQSLWLLIPPAAIPVRGTPGWPALYDSEGVVLRIGSDGDVLSMIPLFMPRIVNPEGLGWSGRVSTDGERLVAASGDESGVRILVFGRR